MPPVDPKTSQSPSTDIQVIDIDQEIVGHEQQIAQSTAQAIGESQLPDVVPYIHKDPLEVLQGESQEKKKIEERDKRLESMPVQYSSKFTIDDFPVFGPIHKYVKKFLGKPYQEFQETMEHVTDLNPTRSTDQTNFTSEMKKRDAQYEQRDLEEKK